MNSFQKVIQILGLDGSAGGDLLWLYSLCKIGAYAYDYEGGDVYQTNCAKEVIRRFELAAIGEKQLARVRQMLNNLNERIERGQSV